MGVPGGVGREGNVSREMRSHPGGPVTESQHTYLYTDRFICFTPLYFYICRPLYFGIYRPYYYIPIYFYIYITLYLYNSISLYFCIYISLYPQIYIPQYLYIYTPLYPCTPVSTYLYTSTSILHLLPPQPVHEPTPSWGFKGLWAMGQGGPMAWRDAGAAHGTHGPPAYTVQCTHALWPPLRARMLSWSLSFLSHFLPVAAGQNPACKSKGNCLEALLTSTANSP